MSKTFLALDLATKFKGSRLPGRDRAMSLGNDNLSIPDRRANRPLPTGYCLVGGSS